MHKYIVIICTCFISGLLTACASSGPELTPGVAATSSFNDNPQQIIKNAQQQSGEQATATQLQAANELIKQRQYYLASRLLQQLTPNTLTPVNQAQQQLLFAKIGLLQNRPGDSLNSLKQISDVAQLPNAEQIQFYKMRAAALLQLGQVVNSIDNRIQLQTLLADNQVAEKQNAIVIWKQLQRLSAEGLQSLTQQQDNKVLAGWAALALTIRQFGNDPQQLLQQLKTWRQQYPQHNANLLLPESFEDTNLANQKITQVALLLPLQGTFKNQAEAVMNGFLAAYRNLPKAQQPKIKIYDTGAAGADVTDLYAKAVTQGANFVIGPLTKENVKAIANNSSCSVPTLMLNYTQVDDSLPSQCFEFGISPVDEAFQAANQAWLSNYDHAVTITPKGDWGAAIANSFVNQWQSLGGRIVDTLNFDQQQTLAQQISQLMGVAQSDQRGKRLQKILLQKVKFLPRRRKDIGVIFINATNAQARQIIPLLKFNFAGRIPIYATSLIYGGVPSPRTDRDLDGVYFLAMPWSVEPTAAQQQLRRQLEHLWPNNFRSNSKLYGLGIDSFTLMQQLNRMQLFPQIAVDGVTGKLKLQSNQQINQQLLWARFIDGRPKLVSQKSKAFYGE